jgi:hypothetical protein
MAAPKIKPNQLGSLFGEKSPNLHDKKIVESLRERLNEKIQKDPKIAKKAALIIEEWLKMKPKP